MIQTPYLVIDTDNPNTAPLNPVVAYPSLTAGNAGPYTFTQTDCTLTYELDNASETGTITFPWGSALTAQQVCNVMNAVMRRARCTVSGGAVMITSTSAGDPAQDSIAITAEPTGILAFGLVPVVGVTEVAFKLDIAASSQLVFAVIDDGLDPETAVKLDIELYGLAPDGMWHKFNEVSIDETGLCDFYVPAPIDYSYIYLRDITAGVNSFMASMMNSIIAQPVTDVSEKRGS